MTETLLVPLESPRRMRLDWILPVLLRPRQTIANIAQQAGNVWAAPLLLLTLTAVLLVLAAGPIKHEAALSGQVELPPDFEYYPPETQAQFLKAMEATQSPVFIYVFPALMGVSGVWVGWLIVSGMLNLTLTLLGGRGATGSAMCSILPSKSAPWVTRPIPRKT
ncbi:MAG TPA: YIP1 family protein [Anaerolineales bacterium]|nr:YIP1 family protein [Anaerolineales bacterium]